MTPCVPFFFLLKEVVFITELEQMEVELKMLKDKVMILSGQYQKANLEHKDLMEKELRELVSKINEIEKFIDEEKGMKEGR